MAQQLELFPELKEKRLNETEEALLYFMQKCVRLESELSYLKSQINDVMSLGETNDEITH